MSRPLTAAQPRRDAGHRPTAHGACRSMAIAGAAVMAILGVQCFLARTALGWSLSQLGRAAEVSYYTVQCFLV
jgi:hypothetical protein